jgi:hypothetical protein
MSNSNKWRRQANRVTWLITFLPLFYLSSCTSPLWWNDPNRGFSYRGWGVNVVDQAAVMRECAAAATVLGCVNPETMTAFSVNNPYVLAHECHHIDAIMKGEGTSGEMAKDIFLTLFGINDLLTAATILFPAPNNCSDGTMAEWSGGKVRIIQASYGKSQILPTLEEWNRMHPDRAMHDSALDEILVPSTLTAGGFTDVFIPNN